MAYPKSALTLDEQIAQLKNRGMIFSNEGYAKAFLSEVSYYYLGLYWFDMRQKADAQDFEKSGRLKLFKKHSSFDEVVKRYNFDSCLKALLTNALGKIEVSLRAKWAHIFSHKYDSLFWCNITRYNEQKAFSQNMQNSLHFIKERFLKTSEDFAENYRNKYPHADPEAWIIAEILYFGDLLYLIGFLKQKDKQNLAHLYAAHSNNDFLRQSEFVSVLNQFRVARNICAHNDRLWNNSFSFTAPRPYYSPLLQASLNSAASQKIYNILCYISYFLRKIGGGAEWRGQIKYLMAAHRPYERAMGFCPDWRSAPLWE